MFVAGRLQEAQPMTNKFIEVSENCAASGGSARGINMMCE